MSNDPKPVPEASKPAAGNPKPAEKEKVSVGDFADLFAKGSSEDTKANKLAQDMPEVEVDDILREGRNLISRLKPKQEG